MSPTPARRHHDALAFVIDFTASHGYPPTVQEVAEGLGLASKSSAYMLLARLQRDGNITHVPLSPRTIVVIDPRPLDLTLELEDGTGG